jgi:serine/threonine protein kinase
MHTWNSELEHLKPSYEKVKGKRLKLKNELDRLFEATDEVEVLNRARRSLELIVMEICENKLGRDRGTEPLIGILEQLLNDKVVPEPIVASMQNLNSFGDLNSLGEFEAYPNLCSSNPVKEALISLTTLLRWYVSFVNNDQYPNKLGKYTVEYVLGEGGMGTVYKGYDKNIHRHVALKTITKTTSSDTTMLLLARLKQEAEAAARLTGSPHIVTVYEYDEDKDEGLAFIAMEYVKGRELKEDIKTNIPSPIEPAINIILQILKALEFAHQHGVIHRDIKPANIMLTDDGQVKLADFGIAKLTKLADIEATISSLTMAGTPLGTEPYMSPEQILGKPFDERSDLFSVGLVLYELLTGSKYQLICDTFAIPSKFNKDIPTTLDKVVQKALNTDIHKRFQTAGEFADALAKVLQKKSSLLVYGVIALLVLVGGGILWGINHVDGVKKQTTNPTVQPSPPVPEVLETVEDVAASLKRDLEATIQTSQNIYLNPLTVLDGPKVSQIEVLDSVLREELAKSTLLKPLNPVVTLGSVSLVPLRQRAKRELSREGMSLTADLLKADSELNGKVQINKEQVTVEIRLTNHRAKIIANATVKFPKSLLAQEIITQAEEAARLIEQPISQGDLRVEIATSHGVHNVTYQAGEFLRLFIRTNQPAYVYVFVADVNKHATRLYPESLYAKLKKVPAGELFILPEDGLPYELIVQAPFGPTTLWVVALTNPPKWPTEKDDTWFQLDSLRAKVRTLGLASAGGYAETEMVVETIGPDKGNRIGLGLSQ